MKFGQITRKLQAILGLAALLLTGMPALAESLSSPDLSSCCTTSYCPLHHRTIQDLQRDKNKCDTQGQSAGNQCSMRACDMASNPAVGTALFVLSAPMSIPYRATAELAPAAASVFFPFYLNLPTTPPPRTIPS